MQELYLLWRDNGESYEDWRSWPVKAYFTFEDAFNAAKKMGWKPYGPWNEGRFEIRETGDDWYWCPFCSGWIKPVKLECPLILGTMIDIWFGREN